MLTQVTDATFADQVLNAPGLVLVDFHSPDCAPCEAMLPALEAIAREQEGKLTVCKIDIAESPVSPADAGVRSVPTVMLFSGGRSVRTISGAADKSRLLREIESELQAA